MCPNIKICLGKNKISIVYKIKLEYEETKQGKEGRKQNVLIII